MGFLSNTDGTTARIRSTAVAMVSDSPCGRLEVGFTGSAWCVCGCKSAVRRETAVEQYMHIYIHKYTHIANKLRRGSRAVRHRACLLAGARPTNRIARTSIKTVRKLCFTPNSLKAFSMTSAFCLFADASLT